jgi:hypothetical protein
MSSVYQGKNNSTLGLLNGALNSKVILTSTILVVVFSFIYLLFVTTQHFKASVLN